MAVSVFRRAPLCDAVGRDAVLAAYGPELDEGRDGDDDELVGMTDYGTLGVRPDGDLRVPASALAPKGGVSLGELVNFEGWMDERDHGVFDGIIIARLPSGPLTLASVAFVGGSIARVRVHGRHAPSPHSRALLGSIGVRHIRASDSECPVHPRRGSNGHQVREFEVDLRTHLQRTRDAGAQPAARGACNGYFLYCGRSGKSTDVMRDALEFACREHRGRLQGPAVPSRRGIEEAGATPVIEATEAALAGLIGELDDAERRGVPGPDPARTRAALDDGVTRLASPRGPVSGVRGQSAARGGSLWEMLEDVCGRLSSSLLSMRATEALGSIAQALADGPCPNPIALECHLGRTEPDRLVDLLACWSWGDGALARPVVLADPPAPLQRLEALWDRRAGARLVERLDQLWLEFDADRGGRPMPAVFFTARARRDRHADLMLPLCEAVASTFYEEAEADPFTAACRSALEFAGTVPMPNIGLMFPRPRSPLRLILAPGAWGDRSTPAHWLGDDSAGRRLTAVWHRLQGNFARALPALDLGPDGLLPSRGMELRIARGPLRRSALAWRAPMQALCAEGLASEAEAAAFGGCFEQFRTSGGEWISIVPAYVKISIDSTGALRAKGYISIRRSLVPVYEIGA